MKKIFSVLFALVLVLSFSLMTVVPVAAATTYTVNDDWQTGVPPYAEDTDGDTDFATIQAAVNAAGSGDTINVAAGTYVENVNINKSVSLNGVTGTILDGTGLGGNGFLIRASNVTIDRFEVRKFAIGIRTYGGPSNFGELNILNCNVHHNTQNGMLIVYDAFSTVTIENCQINSNSQNGIGIANGATIVQLDITGSTISNNGHQGFYMAVNGTTVSELNVENTTMQGNTWSAVTIDTKSSLSDATFDGCTIKDNQTNFVVKGSAIVSNLTLDNCDLANSSKTLSYHHGFVLNNATINGLTIKNTAITNNRWQGLWVQNGATLTNATISGGAIKNNAWGLLTQGSTITNLKVAGVDISNNSAGSGLSVASGTVTGLTVENCTFENNAWEHLDIGVSWIGVVTVSNVAITGNTFRTGPWSSVYIAGNANFGVGDIAIHFNNFVSGAWGVFNSRAKVVDAKNNWWGANNGPGGVGPGSGDKVSAYVDYEPWLLVAFENYVIPTTEGAVNILEGLKEGIAGLDAKDFKKPGAQRKDTLASKVDAVIKQVTAGAFDDAIDKLEKDIKEKIDVDGQDDWLIVQSLLSRTLVANIDLLIGILRLL